MVTYMQTDRVLLLWMATKFIARKDKTLSPDNERTRVQGRGGNSGADKIVTRSRGVRKGVAASKMVKQKTRPTPCKMPETKDLGWHQIAKIVKYRNGYWRVRWRGYDERDDTWEPRSSFRRDCLPLARFERQRKKALAKKR